MKVKSSIRAICGNCKVTRRDGRVMVVCESSPRHRQRQG